MQKFQQWMDAQLYQTHLNKLTKIREKALVLRTQSSQRKSGKKLISFSQHDKRNNQNYISNSRMTDNRNNHHSRVDLYQSRILKQNITLANRIMHVPPVISHVKQIESYNKFKSFFKKPDARNRPKKKKENKLFSFFELKKRNFVPGLHKYLLKFKLFAIPKVSNCTFNTFWEEMIIGSQKILSKHYSENQYLQEEHIIPLKQSPVGKKIYLTIHCSRKLDYINLGTYEISQYLENSEQATSIFAIGNPKLAIQIHPYIQDLEEDYSKTGHKMH